MSLSEPVSFEWILLIVRVIVGGTFIYYGWPKIRDLHANAKDFVHMGFRPGWLFGTVVAFLEFFGGIALILGFYAEVVAALFAFHMATGTFWKMRKGKPFTDYSYDLLLFSLSLVFVAFGSGIYSVANVDLIVAWWHLIAGVVVALALASERVGKRVKKHAKGH